eukprot:scaffold6034_cov87-Skeletonema_dohrnii-CCMP3373.AAC.2
MSSGNTLVLENAKWLLGLDRYSCAASKTTDKPLRIKYSSKSYNTYEAEMYYTAMLVEWWVVLESLERS